MWSRSKITPQWSEDYKKLCYTYKSANDKDISQWRANGYTHEKFTGEMFCDQQNMPAWTKTVGEEIGLINCGFTFYKMQTGIIMPKHVDHFETYCKLFNISRDKVVRAIVALEDWKSGHYFEIDGNPITDWRKGDYVVWDADTPHSAANIGIEDRYTLQITGIKS
jgi:hypothetical protein|tara:strand:- start:39 stop:533 length:495 start_codon:yes stop_codon:yes gene_type:complete